MLNVVFLISCNPHVSPLLYYWACFQTVGENQNLEITHIYAPEQANDVTQNRYAIQLYEYAACCLRQR